MAQEGLKLNLGAIEAVMQLPPSPVMLLAVGEKEQNITTIGMFNVFSVDPTIVGIGIKSSRFSYKLLEETEDFSLNVPGKDLLDQVVKCGMLSGSRMNKFSELGLTPQPGKRIRSPTIVECPLNLEVKKMEQVDRGDWDHIWYMGKVVHSDVNKNYDRSNVLIHWDGEFRTPGPVMKKL